MYPKTPLVSALMSVYNGEKYLCQAIDSILNQTFTDFEFIIIDDGSTDHSSEIINSYLEKDERIKVITNRENIGLAKSLNKGISLSKGEYIARMDADDISNPERLLLQTNFLNENPLIDVVGSWVGIIDQNSQPTGEVWRFTGSPMGLRWVTFFSVPVIHPSVMIRRRIFDEGIQYAESDKYAQDYGLWTRMNNNYRFSNIPRILIKYRVHQDSISGSRFNIQHEIAYRMSQSAINKYLGEIIPIEIVKIINTPCTAQSLYDYKTAIFVLNQLYKKFRADYHLLPIEIVDINLDMADRFIKISKSNHQYLMSWLLWTFAFILKIRTHIFDLIMNRNDALQRKLSFLKEFPHRGMRQII